MTILPAALAATFAASCVWLTARIINRRERWAKWTAAGLLLVVAYPLSTGPVIWLGTSKMLPEWTDGFISLFYRPLDFVLREAPDPIGEALDSYIRIWWPKFSRHL